MPVGLKIPIGSAPSGGLALVDGDENDNKIIALALGDGDNENAYMQGIANGNDMIFDINEPTIRAQISAKIRRIFKDFQNQNRFKLLSDTIEWIDGVDDSGTVNLNFRYLNIESDKVDEFEKSYGRKA